MLSSLQKENTNKVEKEDSGVKFKSLLLYFSGTWLPYQSTPSFKRCFKWIERAYMVLVFYVGYI